MKIPTLITALLCLAGVTALAAEPPVRFGDRVAIVGNTFADQLRIHGYLETLLTQHSNVSVRNLGWGGDMLAARDRPTGFPSEESMLLAHQADVIIACFGMGESFAGVDGVEEFKRELNAFVASHQGKKYNSESAVRLVLVSPIACEDHGKRTPALEARNLDLKAYTQAMGEVAAAAEIPFVDLFEPSHYLMGESKVAKFTTNGIHLNALGYWTMGQAFFAGLVGDTESQWRMIVDAKAASGSGTGVGITELTTAGKGLRFVVAETSPPSLPPPTDAELPLQLSSQRDTLVVTNLEPGKYTLSIDGEQVLSAEHDAWARGVVIEASPAHREAAALREAINDKNRQFTYSWKALNQVHIVGERRSSASGRALPGEVIEFNKLALKRDEEIRDMMKLKTRQWRLEATK